MPKSVLVVDDEKQILRSFNRLFMDAPYEIHTAESGQDALVLLAETQIDMIISDMRMPGMDGYALLREVKRLYPETIRLILSGYADERVIFNALQNNLAKALPVQALEQRGDHEHHRPGFSGGGRTEANAPV